MFCDFVLIVLIFKKLYVYLPQNNLKHQLMKKLILLILILMSSMIPTWAQSAVADDIAQLQKEMYQLYNKNDETAFVDITNKLKEAAQKANDERTFYKAWSNQALYFANHQQRNKGQLIAKDMQQYALNHDHKYGIYTGTHVMGTIQSMMGDYQEGIQNFKKAISYLHENFPKESAAASWIELARISLTNRKIHQAIQDAEQALKEPNISAMHRLNAWSVICLSKVDTALYHVKDAAEYQKEFDYVWGEREKAKKAYGRDETTISTTKPSLSAINLDRHSSGMTCSALYTSARVITEMLTLRNRDIGRCATL